MAPDPAYAAAQLRRAGQPALDRALECCRGAGGAVDRRLVPALRVHDAGRPHADRGPAPARLPERPDSRAQSRWVGQARDRAAADAGTEEEARTGRQAATRAGDASPG